MSDEKPKCGLCGEPMPAGEEMFNYHGFSGNCPKPPLPKPASRFDYVKYDDDAQKIQAIVKAKCQELEQIIEDAPNGRAKSLALTKLEECYMWIGKAIRDEQISRNGSAPLQEERKDG